VATFTHINEQLARGRLELYASNRLYRHHAYANEKVNPGFTNVQWEIWISRINTKT